MLKIKDNVDLKELEKFGFKKQTIRFDGWESHSYFLDNKDFYIAVFEEEIEPNKNIIISIYSVKDDENALTNKVFSVLFDLIKAGMVEKVED